MTDRAWTGERHDLSITLRSNGYHGNIIKPNKDIKIILMKTDQG